MTEIDFHANKEDLFTILGYVSKIGCKFVENKQKFTTKEYQVVENVDDIEFKNDPFLFLLHDSYTEVSLSMKPGLDRDDYFIFQRHGGPYIDMFCTSKITEDGNERLTASSLAHYDSYFNVGGLPEVPAPKALKDIFYDIVKFIKAHSILIRGKARKYHVMEGVQQDIKNGLNLTELDEEFYKHLR